MDNTNTLSRIYDLYVDSRGNIGRMDFGFLEKVISLSLQSKCTIQVVSYSQHTYRYDLSEDANKDGIISRWINHRIAEIEKDKVSNYVSECEAELEVFKIRIYPKNGNPYKLILPLELQSNISEWIDKRLLNVDKYEIINGSWKCHILRCNNIKY